jgi:arginyl-tRNA--protein-N-Asp/Glu arginylyltransferase
MEAHPPPAGAPSRCPYLPDRDARNETILPVPLGPGIYHALMDLNFRRAGPVFFRPRCPGCAECRMIRVVVDPFRPSRAQRRCLKRNADLRVEVGPATPSAERLDLYRRYLAARHDGQMNGSQEEFESFLYSSPLRSEQLSFRLGDRLVAVGVFDVEPLALSCVYCYYDPELKERSLGVLNVLRSVEECRRRGRPYLYLGFYVAGSRAMRYKSSYRPCEVLSETGAWSEPGSRHLP